jgi:hypothetical protein
MPALLACGALIASGCGGGDDSKDASTTAAESSLTARPAPKETLVAQLPAFTKAITRQDCKAYKALVVSLGRGVAPGAAVTAAECKRGDPALVALRGSQVQRAAQLGTGGVMEGPNAAGKPQYTIWAVDSDGHFRYTGVSGTSPQAGTRFTKRAEARSVAKKYLRSIRDGDCPAMERLFSPRGTRVVVVAGGNLRAGCKTVLKGKYLAPAVRKTPKPRIEVLGGTRNLAFVGIATKDAYFTLILGDPATGDLRVFDTVPSTSVPAPG